MKGNIDSFISANRVSRAFGFEAAGTIDSKGGRLIPRHVKPKTLKDIFINEY